MPSPIAVTRERAYSGHVDALYTVAGLPQGRFCTAGSEGVVAVWAPSEPEAETGQALLKTPSPVYALARLPQAPVLLVGVADGGLYAYDLIGHQVLKSGRAHTAAVYDVAAHPTLPWAVGAGGDGQLSLWHTDSLECRLTARVSDQPLRAVAFSADGHRLAVAGSDGQIRVYRFDGLEPLAQWAGHSSTVFTLAFSPDGLTLVSGGRDAHLKAWRTDDWSLSDDVAAHLFGIHHVAYAPGGAWLASGSMDKTLKLWQAPGPDRPLRLLKVVDQLRHGGHRSSVNRILWLDTQRAVTVSDDRQVLQWRFDWVG